ncbi:MAG TPA: hypothetical protein PKC57_14835, partial [Microthrixaceae bacterium]|nr:hypothetical protein [Microthrixaceae bacterium]
GIRHAVEPAERWLNARERAAAAPVAPTPTTVLEGVQRAKERLREHIAAYAAPQQPIHVHEPFPVADDTGTWHAECECGTRWTSTLCDWPGCSLTVTALVVAQTGLPRHKHHQAGS